MLSLFLPRLVVGALTLIALVLSLTLHFLAFLPFSLLKLLSPAPRWRLLWTRVLVAIAEQFIRTNAALLRLIFPVRWDLRVDGELRLDRSYLLISNHQSWADIVLLFDIFRGRIPWLRFFLKKELIWVPMIGFVCWALDFPFMKRYPRQVLEKHPEKARDDLEATRRACERFREVPVTVVNFIEGTRFTEAKRKARNSRYTRLLQPKSGGLAFAISAMGREVDGLIDVTIAYGPTRHRLVWSFLTGEQADIIIEARKLAIPEDILAGDYQNDPEYRARLQSWVAQLWREKDQRLAELRAEREQRQTASA